MPLTVSYSIAKISGAQPLFASADSEIVALNNNGYAYVSADHTNFMGSTTDWVPVAIYDANGGEKAAVGALPTTDGSVAQLTNGNIVSTSIYGGGGVTIRIDTPNGTDVNGDNVR